MAHASPVHRRTEREAFDALGAPVDW